MFYRMSKGDALFALAASAAAMLLGGFVGRPTDQAISGRIEVLHRA